MFSGHKIFAPTGIGALFGKPEVLDAMVPWQGGGNMIKDVTFERTTYHPAPARFEAGTGNIADAVGLGAALDWLGNLGHERAAAYEHELLDYATAELSKVPGLTIIGTSPAKAGVISFVLAGQRTEESGPNSTARASRCARDITARSPYCAVMGLKPPCVLPSHPTMSARISTYWRRP